MSLKLRLFWSLLFGTFIIISGCNPDRKEKIYILANTQSHDDLVWNEHEHFFPEDFNRTQALVDVKELMKLNDSQRKLYDQIIADHYAYPRFKMPISDSEPDYIIALSDYIGVKLQPTGKSEDISLEEVGNFNVLSLDSLVQIVPGLEYLQYSRSQEEIEKNEFDLYLILTDSTKGRARVFPVETIIEEYE